MNDLTIFTQNTLVSKYATPETQKIVSTGNIPAFQLMSSQSKAVKTKKFPHSGHYALVLNQSYKDLGPEVSMLVIAWRPKAVRFKPEFCAAFNPHSELFKTIQQQGLSDPKGASFGPEFLILIPGHGFATFYMGNKSSRAESSNILEPLTNGPFTLVLKVRTAENNKGVWEVPEVNKVDFEIKKEDIPEGYNITLDKFLNPPESIGDDSESAETSTRD